MSAADNRRPWTGELRDNNGFFELSNQLIDDRREEFAEAGGESGNFCSASGCPNLALKEENDSLFRALFGLGGGVVASGCGTDPCRVISFDKFLSVSMLRAGAAL